MRRMVAGFVLLLAIPAAALDLRGARLVDLTHPFGADTIYWPTARPFTLEPVAHGRTPGGWWYAANEFCAAEHGGTHLDAPIHFAEGHATADAVPLERLVGPAVVVDIAARAAADPDALLEQADVAAFEAAHGRIPERTIVLVRTGWSRRWPDRQRYLGTAERDVTKLRFPGVSPAAAAWLVAERRLQAVGIDTASIDRGSSTDFRAHQAFAAADVPIFENLAHLDELPPTGATVIALPMKIARGSGGPLRAIAVLP